MARRPHEAAYWGPVAKANGIHKNVGWHTFRYTFGTQPKAVIRAPLTYPVASSKLGRALQGQSAQNVLLNKGEGVVNGRNFPIAA